ncbi:CPBP family intramembrane glutamic endopeptidase [Metabacillus idriensis]|uniref:CPBP family intramembrane glutamic endopeptidase n=1 Tax=Metabacillus idriensis TaxID=324768 RepID=UPI00163A10EA|nr:CPBP family intramembrane glutamic endopeptidase [Metabacillus idriensis]QNG61402.1 CPBP family intramembrane metalloprotease [Bacillus sp. PAMC26568]
MFKRQNELVKRLSDQQLLQQLYFTQILLLTISVILSMMLFNSMSDFKIIWKLEISQILIIGGFTAVIVVFMDWLIMKTMPEKWYDDGGINEKMFRNRSIPHIFILCLFISFTEELLFRGVIQTQFGIWTASIIFAVLHFRYLTKVLLFSMVMLISILLGFVYDWTGNLFVTVFAHFIIDLVFAIQIRLQFINGGEQIEQK